MHIVKLQNKSVAGCYSDLVAALSFLFLQFGQSETEPWPILQLLFPQGLRIMGIVGQHTLLLHLRENHNHLRTNISQNLHCCFYQPV